MDTEKIWLRNYPNNIPANVDVDAIPNLKSFVQKTFEEFSSKTAFIAMGKKMTYAELNRMSTYFGAYLYAQGIKPGDRIALMMPNILQYPVALFGCIKAGVIVSNTNPLYTPREMLHQFNDSGVTAIVIAENFAYNLEQILPQTKIKHVVIATMGEMLGMVKGSLVNFVVRKVKKIIPSYNIPGAVPFKKAMLQGMGKKLPEFSSSPDDTIILQYTGGTTGVSKGAMLTNKNLIANMLQIRAIFLSVLKPGESIGMCPLPLYHIFAFTVNCLALMSLGCPSVLIANPRDIPGLVKEWKKYNISIFPAVNTLFTALLNNHEFNQLDFRDLKIPIAGGMALQSNTAERWEKLTGVQIVEGYGLTETSPVASVNPLNGKARIGTVGMPVPSTDMRIVDEEGNVLPQGEIGEIQIKGPQVMKGYYEKPEETDLVIKDGWFSSGDIGLMEPDGFFKIVDRKKDMILVSGFNVYPNEIEDVATMHPKVTEAAAIGVPDDKSGELVKLFVVKNDPSLTEEELKTFMRQYLTNYKTPRFIEFREELPKTNVGKILRRLLKNT